MNKKVNRPEGIKASITNGIDDCMKRVTDHSVLNNTNSIYLTEFPEARPFQDRTLLKKFMNWRTFQAIVHVGKHEAKIWGQLDDLIQWPDGTVSPHDYKSNGKERNWDEYTLQYNSLQGDMYEILLHANGQITNGDAYFTYAWPIVDDHGQMIFKHQTVLFKTDKDRALKTIADALDCLAGPEPESNTECEYCLWHEARNG